MGLVFVRPNRGAEKMEDLVRFLGVHHTHPNSSVDVQCHFISKPVEVHALFRPQLVGGASEDVNLLINYKLHLVHILVTYCHIWDFFLNISINSPGPFILLFW